MKAYSEYRTTKHPYLTASPQHWEDVAFKNITTPKSVQNNTGEELLSVFLNRGVVRYSETSQRQVHKPSEDTSKYQLVEPTDVVLNNQQAWRGSVGVSRYRGIVSPAYFVFALNSDINPRFFDYLIQDKSTIAQFYTASRGVGSIQRNIYTPALKNVVLSLPTRAEQDQIERFLDWKVRDVTLFIRAKRREIARLNELVNTRIKDAVLYGLNPETETRDSQIEWIGNIPAHWEVRMLFQEATEQSISNKTVHNQNLLSLSYGKIVNKDINKTDGLLPASFDTYQIVHDGNIILRLTDLQNDKKSLRVGLATQTGIITSAYTCLKPRSHVLSEYLYLLLHSYDICKVFYGMGGGVRQSIGYNDIRRMLLPLPGRDEQQVIVDYCYQLREQTEQMIAALKHEIELVIEYRTRLVSDVVTGKVDVRDIEIPTFEAEAEDAISDDEMDEEAELEEADETEGEENAGD